MVSHAFNPRTTGEAEARESISSGPAKAIQRNSPAYTQNNHLKQYGLLPKLLIIL